MFEDLKGVEVVYDNALQMPFEELQKVADALSRNDPKADMKDPSYCLISFNNVGTLESEVLQIDFLSLVVAQKFSKRLWNESQVKARSMIKHFLPMPQTKGLAGSIFEPFAHRCIVNPDKTDGTWALRLMSSGNDSNSFVLSDAESSETVSGFPKIERQPVSFHSGDFPTLHLYDNAYYTPTMINHPLFDSFVVGFRPPSQAQRLWLLQMTTSNLHTGSQKGYSLVQQIIDQIQQQRELVQPPPAKKQDTKGKRKAVDSEPLSVEVNYVLVRPAGQKEHKWVLPEGREPQSNVYLLELPIDEVETSATTRSKRPAKKKMKASMSAKKK